MSEWIEINGAKMEKSFFDQNLAEAKDYEWKKISIPQLSEHVHCIICGVTIIEQLGIEYAYKSIGGHLCSYCYEHLLK